MEFRRLGRSGLKVSETACGNWITHGLSLAQLAIAWVLQHSNVSAAIIGATRPEQVRENIKAAGVRLDDDLLRKIGSALGHVVITDPALTRSPAERP